MNMKEKALAIGMKEIDVKDFPDFKQAFFIPQRISNELAEWLTRDSTEKKDAPNR